MKIIWDNLQEIKHFLSLVDISKLAKSEEKWGGLGYIIDDEEQFDGKKVKLNRSKVSREGDIRIINHAHFSDLLSINILPVLSLGQTCIQ